ncbi:hypothetical protein NL676_013180 [Syzygium grande]|nr:hypothetical protein NL676_013180 [Syzygium grande]
MILGCSPNFAAAGKDEVAMICIVRPLASFETRPNVVEGAQAAPYRGTPYLWEFSLFFAMMDRSRYAASVLWRSF